jgi:hypothetical protein
MDAHQRGLHAGIWFASALEQLATGDVDTDFTRGFVQSFVAELIDWDNTIDDEPALRLHR